MTRVLAAGAGEILGAAEAVRDRFMIDGRETDGRIAVVEQLMPPRALAAPLHLHTREDEYSYVLEGRVGARLGDDEVIGEPGDLIFQPRGEWHTFWNAGDVPARTLLIISPGGLEVLFRELGARGDEIDPETMAGLADQYGCRVDFDGTGSVIQRHGLAFA